MVVLKLPECSSSKLDKFFKGKYSELYSDIEIARFFYNHEETAKVLLKDRKQKIKFVKAVNEKFNTTLSPKEYDGEIDFPPVKEEEYFNHHL
jgi:hypothetical protein